VQDETYKEYDVTILCMEQVEAGVLEAVPTTFKVLALSPAKAKAQVVRLARSFNIEYPRNPFYRSRVVRHQEVSDV